MLPVAKFLAFEWNLFSLALGATGGSIGTLFLVQVSHSAKDTPRG